jgi:hypothetical protein
MKWEIYVLNIISFWISQHKKTTKRFFSRNNPFWCKLQYYLVLNVSFFKQNKKILFEKEFFLIQISVLSRLERLVFQRKQKDSFRKRILSDSNFNIISCWTSHFSKKIKEFFSKKNSFWSKSQYYLVLKSRLIFQTK